MNKYKHEEKIHNLKNANIIVPEIVKLLNPKSIVGFGLGTFTHAFKRLGVKGVLGIDGLWVNKKLLFKYITPNEFLECNLENEIILDKNMI